MKKDRLSVMVGIFVILTLVLASCQPQTVEVVKEVPVEVEVEVTRVVEVEAPETHTYTVSWVSTDVTSFDPHSCYSTDCLTFMRVVYEALVGYKHGTTDLEGNLAESWDFVFLGSPKKSILESCGILKSCFSGPPPNLAIL